jgi:adenylate kinase
LKTQKTKSLAVLPLRIILIGPQASGKGTQAEAIARNFLLSYICTGVMFREAINKRTNIGCTIQAVIADGGLVNDSLTNQLVNERLLCVGTTQGFVLDGYPRNLAQLEFLLSYQNISHALEIWISDSEAIRRISGRWMCLCGRSYHMEFHPPQIAGHCDACNALLFQRNDDTAPIVKQRLEIYHQQTEPVIRYLQNQGVHFRINGEKQISEVTANLLAVLNRESGL